LDKLISLPATAKTAVAPAVPLLLAAELRVRQGIRYHINMVLLSLGPLVLPYLPDHIQTLQKREHEFSPDLANCLLQMVRSGQSRVLSILIQSRDDAVEGAMPLQGLARRRCRVGKAAKPVVPHLEKAFAHEYEYVTREIAEALGCIGAGVPTLIKALKHKDSITRQNAARALAK